MARQEPILFLFAPWDLPSAECRCARAACCYSPWLGHLSCSQVTTQAFMHLLQRFSALVSRSLWSEETLNWALQNVNWVPTQPAPYLPHGGPGHVCSTLGVSLLLSLNVGTHFPTRGQFCFYADLS